MSDKYFINLVKSDSLSHLIKDGLVFVNSDHQQIQLKSADYIEIKPLYLDEDEEGAVVAILNEIKYVFYLQSFGLSNKVASTAAEIEIIIRGLLDYNSNIESYLASMGKCSAIEIVNRDYKIESTSAYSRNILNNTQWLLRGVFRFMVQRIKIKSASW